MREYVYMSVCKCVNVCMRVCVYELCDRVCEYVHIAAILLVLPKKINKHNKHVPGY